MTNLNRIGGVIALLILLFSVGDLIGSRNQARLEAAWLDASNRLFLSWQTAARNSARWWVALVSVAGAFLLAGSALAAMLYATTLARERWSVGGSPLWIALGLLLAVGLLYYLTLWLLVAILARFLSAPSELIDPLEVRWARFLVHHPLKMPQGGGDSPAAPFIAGCLPFFFVAVGSLFAPLLFIVILARIFAYAGLLFLWVPLLAPARLLHAIGRRTGAESYLKVGKFILSALATVLALYFLFR
ncbi:MAG TPA: hypothetical protein VFT48_04800 [Pyrinomonadaceae bacterium]|nr:hypothetical protein [Pyrinomonadaceae bacterium]